MIFFKLNKGKLKMKWLEHERTTVLQFRRKEQELEQQEEKDAVCDLLMSNEPIYIESITEGFWDDSTYASLCEKDQETRIQLCNAIHSDDFETIGRLFASRMYEYARDAVERREDADYDNGLEG